MLNAWHLKMVPKGINEKKTDPELIEGITEANFISYKLFS